MDEKSEVAPSFHHKAVELAQEAVYFAEEAVYFAEEPVCFRKRAVYFAEVAVWFRTPFRRRSERCRAHVHVRRYMHVR